MEKHSIISSIALAIAATNLIRLIPMACIRGPIRHRFVRSFLYYVPYVTLAVMTFPDMILTPPSLTTGIAALTAGIAAAWLRLGLLPVAAICCLIAYVMG